jgi:hypothetical protein
LTVLKKKTELMLLPMLNNGRTLSVQSSSSFSALPPYITPGRQAACTTNDTTRTRCSSLFEMMAAAAVTRRVNAIASLHVEATNGADEESRRSSSGADDSPVAKRINDAAAKDNDVWVAAQEGDMPAGNSSQPLLFRTMKVKGSILHPYRLLCHFGRPKCKTVRSYVPMVCTNE